MTEVRVVSRKVVKARIFSEVAANWLDVEYKGCLEGYRYCFSKTFSDGFPRLYQHLIVQHEFRKRQVHAFWNLSYLEAFERKLPAGTSSSSEVSTIEVNESANWPWLIGELKFLEFDIKKLKESLFDEQDLELAVWELFSRGELPPEMEAKYGRVARAIVAKPGFSMAQPEALRLNSFLSDFIPQDTVADPGQFSLESSRARSKLSQFQLNDPQNFVVHIVSGAIAGGAESVSVYIDSDDIIVEFGGAALGRVELENLFSNLLSGGGSAQSRELAVALNAASSLRPKSLILESWQGERGWRLQIERESETLSDLSESPFSGGVTGHRVHFRDFPSLKVVMRFLSSLRKDHPEKDVVRERCGLSPVPILLNGTDCRNFPLDEALMYLLWEHPEHAMANLDLGELPGIRQKSPAQASVLLLFGPPSRCQILVHGLSYTAPSQPELYGFWALVVDNAATRDLSFSGLVADKRWERLLKQLLRGRNILAKEICRHYKSLEDAVRPTWAERVQEFAFSGFEKARSLPIYPRVGGGYSTHEDLMKSSEILFTRKEWSYGLIEGGPVHILTPTAIQRFKKDKYLYNVDHELSRAQDHFSKLEVKE